MIEILKAILFGIVEGITEWLPISSTGHMILLDEFIHLGVSDEFYKLFQVVIQLGAILAVIVMYFKTIFPWGFKKTKQDTKDTLNLWGKILVACIPAAIIGLLFDDWLDEHLYNSITVSITLIIYGILFIVIEIFNKKREFKINDITEMSLSTALIIGCIQLLALIPGTSRSGVTILGAMLIGCNRTVSAEFSFFLSIPVMLGASLLKAVKFFMDNTITTDQIIFLLVGVVVAFIVSMLVIKFLMKYIKKHDFKIFGIYRIILGIILIILFATQVISV